MKTAPKGDPCARPGHVPDMLHTEQSHTHSTVAVCPVHVLFNYSFYLQSISYRKDKLHYSQLIKITLKSFSTANYTQAAVSV